MTFRDCAALHRTLTAAGLAAALLGAAPAVLAQSQVRIFGTFDAGVEYVNTGDAGTSGMARVSSGSGRASRIVFDGSEDLGGGLAATFFLDIGFWGDTGAVFPTGPGSTGLFGRRAVLGLSSRDLGGITVGREYTPQFWIGLKSDIAGNAYYGNTVNRSRQNSTRASNAIEYTSPSMGGFTVVALASTGAVAANNGSEATSAPLDEGRQRGLSLEYSNERLFLGVVRASTAAKETAAATTTVAATDTMVAGKYRFDAFTVSANWGLVDPPGAANDIHVVMLGLMRRLTPASQVGLQLSRSRQDAASAVKPSERVISLHYSYDLSKRTMLYTNYARQANSATSAQPLIAAIGPNTLVPKTKGTTLSALLLGMSHNF